MSRYNRILEIHKIAVNKENEALRNSFEKKFIGENIRKTYAIADQWYSAFNDTSVYETWKFLDKLNDVILFIKENKSSVERSSKKVVNKNLKILSEKYPGLIDKIKKANDKSLSWLASRYGGRVEFEPDHPIEQAIDTILRYQDRVKGLRQKFDENVEYKNLFKNIGSDATNPSDMMNLSVNDMEMAIGLADRPRGIHTVIPSDYEPKEFLGQFGQWKLWLPITRTDSIAIAKYNKYSMIPDTDWCTARTVGHNLFYSYATNSTFLFYAIKDGATKDNLSDYQSIGIKNGHIVYDGHGTETVDGDNGGMTEESHKEIFGDNLSKIYNAMLSSVQSYKGLHPAEKLIDQVVYGDQEAYNDLKTGAGKEELEDLELSIKSRRISIASDTDDERLLNLFINDKEEEVRSAVAENSNISNDMINSIIENDTYYVMRGLSLNDLIYLPENINILEKLSKINSKINDYARDIITNIAKNEKTPFYIIKSFILRKDSAGTAGYIEGGKNYLNHIEDIFTLIKELAELENSPYIADALEAILSSRSTSVSLIKAIADLAIMLNIDLDVLFLRNNKTPIEILRSIFARINKTDIDSIKLLINHPMATEPFIERVKEDAGLLWSVEKAGDPNTPIEELERLSGENSFDILKALVKNPSAYTEGILNRLTSFMRFEQEIASTTRLGHVIATLPPGISEKLSFSKNRTVRRLIARRSDTPEKVLARLASDTQSDVRECVFNNKKTPINIVVNLSKEFGANRHTHGGRRAVEYLEQREAFEVIESLYEYRDVLNNEGIDINQEMRRDGPSSTKLYSLSRRIAEAGSFIFYEADLTDIDLTAVHSVVWAKNYINKNKENANLSRDQRLALSLAKEIMEESEDNEEGIDMANDKLGTLVRWLLKSGFEKEASSIFSIYKESTLKIKVSPLEAAVALGLLPASILLDDEDDKKKKKKEEDKGEKDVLENLLKELKEFELEKEAAKKKKKSKKKKDRTPTKPELWSASKAWAKRKYDVWPSAYAVGAALKRYKKKGGGWRGPKPKK